MGNVIPPQYGVPLTADELNSSIPTSILYGVTPSNEFIPIQINAVGAVTIDGQISVGTVTIEGVDPVDSSTHPLALVNFGSDGYALRTAIFDGGNQLVVNPDGSINVGNFPSTQNVNVTNASIPVTQSGSWTVSLTNESIEIGTVDQGTPNTLANGWPVKITDGSNVLGTLANPVRVDPTGATTQPISGSVSVSNFPVTQPVSGTVTVDQGTSPWIVSGSITTSPDVNVHDGSGNAISSTGSSLNVDVTNTVPVTLTSTTITGTVAVTQSTSPWVISGTVTANAGTGNFTVVQGTGTNLHTVVDNFPSVQTVAISQSGTDNDVDANITNTSIAVTQSGTWTVQQGTPPWSVSQSGVWSVGRTWTLSSGTDSVNIGNFPATQAVTQSTSPWVISGSVTANIGTTGGLALDSSLTTINTSLGTIDTDIKASQPRKLQDGAGNNITSQVSGLQRALDVGIDVAGVQIDPRSIRALTSSDVVTADQGGTWTVNTVPPASSIDLYGRNRVSQLESLFSSDFLYDKQTLLWDELTATGGTSTFTASEAAIFMAVTSTTGSRVVRQTKEYFVYEPGRAQTFLGTAVMGGTKTNCAQRIGVFDDNNGCYFEHDGTNLNVVVRSSVSGSPNNTAIPQSSWNIDKLNGTGASGYNIDVTKGQVYLIEYQWFGVGAVRFGVVVGGDVVYCHRIDHNNVVTSVYMQRGSLPIRYEIVNTGSTSGSTTLKQICSSADSSGGYEPKGVVQSFSMGTSTKTFNDREALFTIRLKSGYNRATVVPLHYDILATTANNVEFELVLNGTLGGTPNFNLGNATSAVEIDVSGTTVTGGIILDVGFLSSQTRNQNPDINDIVKMVANIAGTSDTISLVAQGLGGGNVTLIGGISWIEYLS